MKDKVIYFLKQYVKSIVARLFHFNFTPIDHSSCQNNYFLLSAGAVEYTDYTYAEG